MTEPPKLRFIVAEVSKTWLNPSEKDPAIIATRFEDVIAVNLQRGYLLHSWRLAQYMAHNVLVETIVAVFEKAP